MDRNTIFFIDDSLKDSSEYSHSISNTNVILSTEQSKIGDSSLYFSGESYLDIPLSINVSGNFTIDWWAYQTSSSNYPTFFELYNSNSTTRGYFVHGPSGGASGTPIYLCWASQSANIASQSDKLNQWVHYALTQVGTLLTLYVNGESKCVLTRSSTNVPNAIRIGTVKNNYTTNGQYTGYIDSFRISNIIRWTENFTPPEKQDYYLNNNEKEDTIFLLKPKKGIKDCSSNKVTITNTNTILSTDQSQFGENSIYFNGSSKLQINISDIGLDLNQDWSFDWWEYPTTSGTQSAATFCMANTSGNYGFVLGASISSGKVRVFAGDSSWNFIPVTSIVALTANAWSHYAACKKDNLLYLFKNGALQKTVTVSNSITMKDTLTIGYRDTKSSPGGYTGYLDNIRISNVARWTSDFKIPEEKDYDIQLPLYVKQLSQWKPIDKAYIKNNGNWIELNDTELPNHINNNIKYQTNYIWSKSIVDKNIKCLLHGDSLNDSSFYSIPIANTGVTINSTQQHFNNDSLYFNGSAYLTINDTTLCNGTNDWTIDWWEYRTSDVTNAGTITRNGPSGSYNGLLLGYTIKSSNLLQFYAANSATSADWNMISGCTMGSIILNQWVHRCVVRNGSNFYCFENGILKGTATSSESFNATAPIQIGYYAGENYYGYLSEICFRDNAKWTSDFTPPIEPYIGFKSIEYVSNENINTYPTDGFADDGYYYRLI